MSRKRKRKRIFWSKRREMKESPEPMKKFIEKNIFLFNFTLSSPQSHFKLFSFFLSFQKNLEKKIQKKIFFKIETPPKILFFEI